MKDPVILPIFILESRLVASELSHAAVVDLDKNCKGLDDKVYVNFLSSIEDNVDDCAVMNDVVKIGVASVGFF